MRMSWERERERERERTFANANVMSQTTAFTAAWMQSCRKRLHSQLHECSHIATCITLTDIQHTHMLIVCECDAVMSRYDSWRDVMSQMRMQSCHVYFSAVNAVMWHISLTMCA